MASMVVLYFVAILYSESPLCTVYVIFVGSWDGSSISAGFGNFNIWPIDKIFDVNVKGWNDLAFSLYHREKKMTLGDSFEVYPNFQFGFRIHL